MKRLLFTALLLLIATKLPALDYTVSIRIDPRQYAIDQNVTRCFARLLVGETLIKEVSFTLPDGTGNLPLTLTFENVRPALTEALSKQPTAEVKVVYASQKNNDGLSEITPFATQIVPAVAYATIADNVEKAISNFTVNGTLKAKDISVNGKTEIALTSANNSIHTLTTHTSNAESLHVNQTFNASSATLAGTTTFNARLKGRGTVPIGTILMFTSNVTLDDHWQLCDGSPITEGPFEGKHTPNLQGRFPYATQTFSKVGTTGGAQNVTLTKAHLPAHTHSYTLTEPYVITENLKGATQKSTGSDEWISGADKTVTSSEEGSQTPTPLSLLPPYHACLFYIRIK